MDNFKNYFFSDYFDQLIFYDISNNFCKLILNSTFDNYDLEIVNH